MYTMYTFMTALCKHWCWRQTWFSSDCGKEQEAAIEDFMRKLFHGLFTSQRVVYTYRCTLPSVMQCAIWTVQNCIGCEKKEDVPLVRSLGQTKVVTWSRILLDILISPMMVDHGHSALRYIYRRWMDFLWKLRKCCWFPWIFADFSDNFSDKIDDL